MLVAKQIMININKFWVDIRFSSWSSWSASCSVLVM